MLVWCWTAAVVLSIAWFLIQPFLIDKPLVQLRWMVAGGFVGLATVVAVVLAFFRAPSRLIAALSMDARFGLRERVTTSLTLEPKQIQTPAGQALLEDVNQRIRNLDVATGFPVRMQWVSALLPVSVGLLALVAIFYEPPKSQATSGNQLAQTEPPVNSAAIDQKMKELKKRKPPEANAVTKRQSEDLERIEAELEKIANKPHDTKEEVRERIKDMTALEEALKGREKELAEKSRSLKQQLERLDRLGMKDGEGPAKDLEKALSQGKLDKAKEEIARLNKRLQNNELSAKEKEQLKKQLEKLKDNLERLAQQKDKEQQLRQANLDPETLQRELKQLQKDSQKLKDLQDLANQLGKCQKCLKEGNMEGASESLGKAGEKLRQMEMDDQDLQDMRDQLARLQDAKESCCNGMGEKQGDVVESESEEDSNSAGIGAGRRPLGKDKPFRSFDAKTKTEFDAKGKKIFDGYAPSQSFQKKSGAELAGEIKQATQEAPEAIEQQRIPKAAQEMAKGYFRKMREQAERDQKSPSKQ
jgi:hypothetical protein